VVDPKYLMVTEYHEDYEAEKRKTGYEPRTVGEDK